MTRRRHLLAACALSFACVPAFASGSDRWDETWDIIVVGAGYAGLAAAIEARRAGLRVLLVEKMESVGGNSSLSTGDMAVPDSPVQRRLGILDDSPERMAKDMLRAARIADPRRCRTVAEGALSTWLWTRDELGVQWVPDALQRDEGMSRPRGCMVYSRSGQEIVSAEFSQFLKMRGEFRPRCLLSGLVMEKGAVVGIHVLEGFVFGQPTSGTPKRLRARSAVVLCSGGFGADTRFRERLDARLGEQFPTDNQPGATSEALRAAIRIGAAVRDLAQIQVLPWISADEVGIGNGWTYIEHVTVPYGIWIDGQGRRFVNELSSQAVRSQLAVDVLAAGGRVYGLVDENGIQRSGNFGRSLSDWPSLVKRGIVRRYASLEELAEDCGFALEEIRRTVDETNAAIRGQMPDAMGRPRKPNVDPQLSAPWYLIEIQPKIHHCMGGSSSTRARRCLTTLAPRSRDCSPRAK